MLVKVLTTSMGLRENVECRKCGQKVSIHYSYCPNCQTPIARVRPIITSPPEVESDGNRSLILSLRGRLGELSNHEKHYAYVFVLSAVAGSVFGLFNQSLALTFLRRFRQAISEPAPTHPLSIFSHNFVVGLLSVLTGGISMLLSQFLTFAAVTGLLRLIAVLPVAHIPLTLIVILSIGFMVVLIVEQGGFLCFSVVGFTGLERIVWKRKTKLRRIRFLLLGTFLLFIAAILEWWLEVVIST